MRTIAIVSISLGVFAVPARADAQGVLAGSLTGGPAFNVPNEMADAGVDVSMSVERRDGVLGVGVGFGIVSAPETKRTYPQYTTTVYRDSVVMAPVSAFVAVHSRHRVDDRGAEWFGQGGLALELRGFLFPELRAGVDWWVNSRRAVRVAVHQMYAGSARNVVALDVGFVFR